MINNQGSALGRRQAYQDGVTTIDSPWIMLVEKLNVLWHC
jgi:hypothetical protein